MRIGRTFCRSIMRDFEITKQKVTGSAREYNGNSILLDFWTELRRQFADFSYSL